MTDPRRVYADGAYVVGQGGRRVYADGVYVVHGHNQRRVYADGIYVVTPESVGPPPLVAPALFAAATAPGEITVSQTDEGTGYTSVALYGADSASDLPEEGPEPGADLLDADWDLEPLTETDLGDERTRWYRAYATDGEDTVASNLTSATTEAQQPPCRPVITAEALSETVARLTLTGCGLED